MPISLSHLRLLAAAAVAGTLLGACSHQTHSTEPAPREMQFQVHKVAAPMLGNPAPRYPSALLGDSMRRDGQVTLQYVVTEKGRVDISTVQVVRSSDSLFTAAVLDVLPQWKYFPAEIDSGGHAECEPPGDDPPKCRTSGHLHVHTIRQMVEQTFQFSGSGPARPATTNTAPPPRKG